MGEYANLKGKRIKIGTCEDMLYLRADQAHLVEALPGNVDPLRDHAGIRFRFPWPDEDDVAPGMFDPFERSIGVHDMSPDPNCEHSTIQFAARVGLHLSLPCPNGSGRVWVGGTATTMQNGPTAGTRILVEPMVATIHRNGYAGDVQLVQQRAWEGRLWAVCKCGACGSLWRLPEEQGIALAVALRADADTMRPRTESRVTFLHAIADRVLAGYETPFPTNTADEP